MKFLIDTNILIPSEPTSVADVHEDTPQALEFHRLVSQAVQQVYVHPEGSKDVARDKNEHRRRLRQVTVNRYVALPDPPRISPRLEAELGKPDEGTNDWVDHCLLAAVEARAVNYLISQDVGIHRKARRLGLQQHVIKLPEAISLLRDLFDRATTPPPAVVNVKTHALNAADPIFQSLRDDYQGFDAWLESCKLKHRDAWIIRGDARLAAVCIIKAEESPLPQTQGKTLKLCTFKVSDDYNGNRFGELLLKTAFTYAAENRYQWIYVTAFPKQTHLLGFLSDFGFEALDVQPPKEEVILSKPVCVPASASGADPVAFQRRYGPFNLRLELAPSFVVPIQPVYHRLLFPEVEKQVSLFTEVNTFGSAIRKAYLCRSSIRRIEAGAHLFFYRSDDAQHVQVIGTVEDTLVSADAEEIAPFVAKRTVYTHAEIQGMCQKSDVLAILFRQARILKTPITIRELLDRRVLTAPPQTIVAVPAETSEWLQTRIGVASSS